MNEREQDVETNSEADSPVEFDLILLSDGDVLAEPGVLVPARLLNQAFVSSLDCALNFQVLGSGLSDGLKGSLFFHIGVLDDLF